MAKNIERVNYYEREYLRSFDFEAEQRYHMEMRRRLNLALHRWGIVFGLQLEHYKEFGIDYVRILPGMAIDAHGREIVLPATHTISEDDFRSSGVILSDGPYSIWLAYNKSLETPPSAGYRICDLTNQYTRLRESAVTLIRDVTWPGPTQPEPLPFEALSDDSRNDAWPLFLGNITVAGSNIAYDDTTQAKRRYIGLRAQNIITPHNHPTSYDVLQTNAPKKPPTSLEIDTNTFINDNLIIGSDFAVPNSITPTPPTQPVGNAKVSSDLYVNGRFYINKTPSSSPAASSLVHVDDYIKTIVSMITPEIVIGNFPFTVSPPSTPETVHQEVVKVSITPTKLRTVTKARMMVGISELQWRSLTATAAWNGDIGTHNTNNFRAAVDFTGWHAPVVGSNQHDFDLTFSIGPTRQLGGTPFDTLIFTVTVNYLVVFEP